MGWEVKSWDFFCKLDFQRFLFVQNLPLYNAMRMGMMEMRSELLHID